VEEMCTRVVDTNIIRCKQLYSPVVQSSLSAVHLTRDRVVPVAHSVWRTVKLFVAVSTASPSSVGGEVIVFITKKDCYYSGNI